MVAAMATIVGPVPGLAEIARMAAESIEGWLREYPGYRGLVVLTDEGRQRSRVITFWETAEDEARARESRGAMRDSVASTVGMDVVDMEVCDVPVLELATG
jgi:heme-degrading monooxygenase HmoA